MPKDPELLAHQHWLGYLQPVGLVVSPPALVQCQAFVNSNVATEQARFLEHLHDVPVSEKEPRPAIKSLTDLLTDPALFDWRPEDLVPADDPRASALEVVLTDYHETLKPTFAVPDSDGEGWLLLVQELPLARDLDAVADDAKHWEATPEAKFERLLRVTGVPIGLLSNGTHLRLVYNPRVETPGHITFPVAVMTDVPGRPVLAALLMLLRSDRLFTLPDRQRLPNLLAESRKYQNTVSTELAQQVLAALFELLRGFQAADDQRKGELLRKVLATDPDEVYAGLVTVLMRLVFLLYADDRGLMADPDAAVYHNHYSVAGLFNRLREDAGQHPDTMDSRYGAWAQLVALFRLVHDGGGHGKLRLPQRHGHLFDYRRYAFLEGNPDAPTDGRPWASPINPPLISDGVVWRVLNNLLVVDGERLSYSHLDVEHIGSVYESIMGYRLEKATGRSIALKPKKTHGAPITIDLDALLTAKPADRGKFLAEHADQKVEGKTLTALKAADTVEGLVAALEKKIAKALTPNIVPPGGMIFQPSDERRRAGAHYTPRTMTGPIVRKALEPVLKQLGDSPTPEQILGLKVCDPAMGSGAFLVEACRQLGEALVKAWAAHGGMPKVPDDETPELLAQRTIAQRCLYGVDKNPMAVNLAKLSLWLATLAKDHPFTFLDHSMRCGDSLVGLTEKQIRTGHWSPGAKEQMVTGQEKLRERVEAATQYRRRIIEGGEFMHQQEKEDMLKAANAALDLVRFAGNLAVAAFFSADKDKKRLENRTTWFGLFGEYMASGLHRPNKEEASLREGSHSVTPFHWEIEYPEVFARPLPDGRGSSVASTTNPNVVRTTSPPKPHEPRPSGSGPGFDIIVGNPPFAGKNTIGDGNRDGYLDWLKMIHEESHGNADLVAHFFRRAFNLLRPGGTFGLIATNTIAQGDTRSSGLRWICTHGGTIYSARRRYKWPGQAAVVVSVVHVAKGPIVGPFDLDGDSVPLISAYLFHAGGHDDPAKLRSNEGKSFIGSYVLGMGFTFDDTDKDGVANPISLMHDLIAKDNRNAERIFPYIGGEEVNNEPRHLHHRYVINFGDMTEEQARKWPDLMRIVEEKVKPARQHQSSIVNPARWWMYARPASDLATAQVGQTQAMVIARVGQVAAFTFLPSKIVFSEQLVVSALPTRSAFCTLQCRVHEIWVRAFGSSMKDDLRYTPSDCFETFPFPENFESHPALEAAGLAYYDFRAALMVRNNEGLTKTYNRFHDPNETSADIVKLRELHAAMDRAVLDAYGGDLAKLNVPPCEFLLDYEDDDEDEEETGKRQRKKPWRYRWPDAFRDEVLALLLDLNKQRAEQERLDPPDDPPKKPRGKKLPKPKPSGGSKLFES